MDEKENAFASVSISVHFLSELLCLEKKQLSLILLKSMLDDSLTTFIQSEKSPTFYLLQILSLLSLLFSHRLVFPLLFFPDDFARIIHSDVVDVVMFRLPP